MMSFSDPAGIQALNGEVTRQAAMVAYVDDFRLMMLITLGVMPLLLLMRTPQICMRRRLMSRWIRLGGAGAPSRPWRAAQTVGPNFKAPSRSGGRQGLCR